MVRGCVSSKITQHVRGCVSPRLFFVLLETYQTWIRRSIAVRVHQLVVIYSVKLSLQLGRIQSRARFSRNSHLTRSPQSHRTNASRAFARYCD